MRGWNEQRRNRLGDHIAAHFARLDRDEHVAILECQAPTHPSIEAAVGFWMDTPEARVDLRKHPSMCCAELHDCGHILNVGRSHPERPGVRSKPMLCHVERHRLIAMALIERPQTSC